MDIKYSVLIPVYYKENPVFFAKSLDSVLRQTYVPDEVLIVKDGPLTDSLEQVIADRVAQFPSIRCLSFAENQGLGIVLSEGVSACRNELIGRMDSDDIAVSSRFKLQLESFAKDPDLCLLSGTILEFQQECSLEGPVRRLPLNDDYIRTYAKKRNPMNHMAVMFRRSAVISVGNYRHMPGFEDYDLWLRMLHAGFKSKNLSEVLVFARCGNGMVQRRGGIAYTRQLLHFQLQMMKCGLISPVQTVANILIRVPVAIAPRQIRSAIYSKILRFGKEMPFDEKI